MLAAAAPSAAAILRRSSISLHLIRRLHPRHLFLPSFSCTLRLFCAKTLTATTDADAVDTVREFKKRLKISELKGGADEGLERLGQKLLIRGWVRTCRIQSSVTFIEVNDGSCISNMQCVMESDAEGYDQVEAGDIATGASVIVHGTIVASPGKKQKVELKVEKLTLVRNSLRLLKLILKWTNSMKAP